MALVAAGLTPKSAAGRKGRGGRRRDVAAKRRGFVLKVVEGPLHGREYSFQSVATIGRVEESDIVVLDPGISRNHARLYEHLGVFMLEDKGSANGTALNGERIDGSEVLREGDLITIGQTTFRFSQLHVVRGEVTKEVKLQGSALNDLDVSRTSEVPRFGLLAGRRGRLVLATAVLALGGIGALGYVRMSRDAGTVDASNQPIPYDEASFAGNVLGFGKYDKTHPERVIVEFGYLGGRVTLQLGAWGIEQADEVEILLNDKRVGHLPVTMSRWTYGIKIELPRDALRAKGPNELVFNATRNPPGDNAWEIYDLHIIQEPIPRPNEQDAYTQYERGKKIWEDRQVEPGNMYAALMALRKARNLLEGLSAKPELYEVIGTFIDRIDGELTKKFDEGLFTARRLQRVDNDLQKVDLVLRRTLRFFGKSDYRYRELTRFLKSLEEPRDYEE